jgi:PAS domain S-box-containing protein
MMPDGTVKLLHLVRHPVLNDAGEVVQLIGTTMDITERKRNEEALRRSEAYLAESQRLSHTGSWAYDPAGETIHWSEEMFRIYNFDPQQGPPTRAQRNTRIHPEDLESVRQARHKMLYEKVDCDFEHIIVLPDGRVRHVHVLGHPVLSPTGEVLGTVGTTVDITERKCAEEALRQTGAYLADAHRLTHTGAWAGDPTTAPVYWSEEVFRLFGFDPQHGLPTRDEALQRIHPEDLDNFKQAFDRVIHEKVDSEVEFRIVLPDGIVKHVHAIGHPVLDANGEVVEVVGTTVDITERKRAEQELREGETRFRTFVDHAGDALFVYDLEQKTVVDVNREACKSLGYTRQELVGNTPAAYHLDSYQAEMESVAQRAMAGETVFDTHWHMRKDGTVFPVEVHTTLVSYTGRGFLLMVARDISDRLQAEEQRKRLRQLEADMAHIARVSMMGELAASIAHEVNQPLSGIVSSGGACLRWLAADPPNLEEVREAVRRIVGAGKHAGEVIARIRALTKRTAAPQEKLDLNETIREVLPLVGDEAKRNKAMIRTQFANDISPILGDQVQVQQVVLNLVMNGIEAMSSVGERERELVIITRNIDPEQVQVTVEDSGIGIDPNTIQKIFDPFYTTKSTGMGMGLSISRSILQHHGGRLWATAKDGPGTSFHFTLPKYHEEESNAGV